MKKQRAIITVIGKDQIGIVAKVTTLLAEHQINIMDISQRIMDGIFTMTMLVDLEKTPFTVADLSDKLKKIGKEIGQEIHVHDEEIIKAMHRI
jgi:ACT domain-containing protein